MLHYNILVTFITVLIKCCIFIYNFIGEPKSSQNIYFIGLNYLDYESFLDTLDVLDTSLITYTLTLFIYESPLLLCSCIITSVIYFPVFYRILFFPLVRENGTLRQKGRRSNYRLHQWAQFKKKWNSLFLFGSGVGYFSSISFGTFSNIYIFWQSFDDALRANTVLYQMPGGIQIYDLRTVRCNIYYLNYQTDL